MGRGATLPREASRVERVEGGLRLRGREEGCDEESGASAGKLYDDSAGVPGREEPRASVVFRCACLLSCVERWVSCRS